MADVRIDELTSEVTVTDATALLSDDVLARIVREVMARLAEQERLRDQLARERRIGGGG